MMIFLSLLFLVLSLKSLIGKASLTKEIHKELKLYQIADAEGETPDDERKAKLASKGCLSVLYMITLLVLNIVFIISALGNELLLYPALILVLLFVINSLTYKKPTHPSKMSPIELENYKKEVNSTPKKKFSSVVISLINISCYGYMFYAMIFLSNI